MQHRIGMAIVCLHISAVLYLLAGILMVPLFLNRDRSGLGGVIGTALFLLALLLAVGIEFVVHGLGQRQFWAWVAGLRIFGVYLPSLFFPLGALGLWGLLDHGSRAEFGIGSGHP
jgi:hypothetical protein